MRRVKVRLYRRGQPVGAVTVPAAEHDGREDILLRAAMVADGRDWDELRYLGLSLCRALHDREALCLQLVTDLYSGRKPDAVEVVPKEHLRLELWRATAPHGGILVSVYGTQSGPKRVELHRFDEVAERASRSHATGPWYAAVRRLLQARQTICQEEMRRPSQRGRPGTAPRARRSSPGPAENSPKEVNHAGVGNHGQAPR